MSNLQENSQFGFETIAEITFRSCVLRKITQRLEEPTRVVSDCALRIQFVCEFQYFSFFHFSVIEKLNFHFLFFLKF